jgi:ureidoglycolate lyase
MTLLTVEPLTQASFSPFGQVVDPAGLQGLSINQGFATRYNLQAQVETREGGHTQTGIFVADPRPVPIAIALMERHPLGSQLFYPLQNHNWLVVVCADPLKPETYRAFEASGTQGVNYAPGVWHHPLLVREKGDRFFIVDRAGQGNNLDEIWLEAPLHVQWLH